MQYHKPLIKNKLFVIFLTLAILSALTSLSLFFYEVVHLDSCIAWNACTEQSSGYYSFCVKDGYKFCCGGWGTDTQSCGGYLNNCRKKNYGYINCGPIFTAELVLNIIALGLLIILVVMFCLHKKYRPRNPQQNYSLVTTIQVEQQDR